nr:acylsugar acyltransferase 3-like [Tanacetum cinerariifolium]
MKPEAFINDFRKQKMEFCSLRNIETALGSLSTSESDLKEMQGIIDAAYFCSSLSRYPIYDVDFGWGTPLKATVAGSMVTNCFLMISTPDQDGIEVFATKLHLLLPEVIDECLRLHFTLVICKHLHYHETISDAIIWQCLGHFVPYVYSMVDPVMAWTLSLRSFIFELGKMKLLVTVSFEVRN